ncbi:MAG: hypothetical protein U1E36_01785 [Rickettsiales bacterium]
MTVLSGLILASGMTFNRFAVSTIAEYGRLYQIQIPFDDGKEEKAAAAIVTKLKSAESIAFVRQLDTDEVRELLSPWLGESSKLDALPIPIVIEIKLKDEDLAQAQAADLMDGIKKQYPFIMVDQYDQALQQFSNAARTVQFITYGLGILIIIATIIVVVLTTRASVQLHFPIVRLLHRIGAPDGYISRQFQLNATVQTLKGAVPGTLIAWLFFLIFQHILSSYDLLSLVTPLKDQTLILFFFSLPIMLGLIVAGTTYGAVRQMLYKIF